MKNTLLRCLCVAALVGSVCNVQAAKPDNLVEKKIDSVVVSAGAFSQQFVLNTDANYNPNSGSITVSGLSSLFNSLTLNVFSQGGQSLSGLLVSKSLTGNQIAKFSDKMFPLDLQPSTSYRIQVSGVSNIDNASFGIKGTFVQSISPVPEPESYIMLLAGLGCIAGIAKRRAKIS